VKVEDLTAAYAVRYPLAEARVRAELDIAKAEAKSAVLTLDEVRALGGEVDEDGDIRRFGPTISALIDEYGAILPDAQDRTSPEALAEGVERYAQRHAEGIEQRRFERVASTFEDTFKDAAASLAQQTGMSANAALASIARGQAFDLRESGKADASKDMFEVVKRVEARDKPTLSTAEKVEQAIAEQADD
jgi:hypothetical protein